MSKIDSLDFAEYVNECHDSAISIYQNKSGELIPRNTSLSNTINKFSSLQSNNSEYSSSSKWTPDPLWNDIETMFLSDTDRIENGGEYNRCMYAICRIGDYNSITLSYGYHYNNPTSSAPQYSMLKTLDNQVFSNKDATTTEYSTATIDCTNALVDSKGRRFIWVALLEKSFDTSGTTSYDEAPFFYSYLFGIMPTKLSSTCIYPMYIMCELYKLNGDNIPVITPSSCMYRTQGVTNGYCDIINSYLEALYIYQNNPTISSISVGLKSLKTKNNEVTINACSRVLYLTDAPLTWYIKNGIVLGCSLDTLNLICIGASQSYVYLYTTTYYSYSDSVTDIINCQVNKLLISGLYNLQSKDPNIKVLDVSNYKYCLGNSITNGCSQNYLETIYLGNKGCNLVYAANLQNVRIGADTDTASTFGSRILTHYSLLNIAFNLKDNTGLSAKTITIKTDCTNVYCKEVEGVLTETTSDDTDGISVAQYITNKNWTLAI